MKYKKLTIKLTKKQIYQIREFVDKNGYQEGCGKQFCLLTQPIIKDFDEHLDVLLFSDANGLKIYNFITKRKNRRFQPMFTRNKGEAKCSQRKLERY